MKNLLWYMIAALGEIAGCYAFWVWLRMGKGASALLWGIPALVVFAWALTKVDTAYAGRAFAAYSAVYLVGSLLWMKTVEKGSPDGWDILGAGICLLGAGVILFAPRGV